MRDDRVKELFDIDTKGHVLKILKDDGLYRHLIMRNPSGGGGYWYEILTWPGGLMIRGDMNASPVFTRIPDMFEFFRRRPGEGINPDYWAEKTNGGRHAWEEYDEDAMRARITEAFVNAARDRGVPAGTGKALRRDVLDEDLSDRRTALDIVNDFSHGAGYTGSCSCGERTRVEHGWARGVFDRRHELCGFGATWVYSEGFSFAEDAWEWDVTGYSHGFLWACHAIVKAIAAYDARPDAPGPQNGVYGVVTETLAEAVREALESPEGDAVKRLAIRVKGAADKAMGFRG